MREPVQPAETLALLQRHRVPWIDARVHMRLRLCASPKLDLRAGKAVPRGHLQAAYADVRPLCVNLLTPLDKVCPVNEHYNHCGNQCEIYCESDSQTCPRHCRGPGACVCNKGFERAPRGDCVPSEQCSATPPGPFPNTTTVTTTTTKRPSPSEL